MALDQNLFYKLKKLFADKKWEDNDEYDEYSVVFDRYCAMFELLGEDEQNLVFALSEEFRHFPDYKYHSLIKKVVNLVDENYFAEAKSIYLLSLKSPQDIAKVKSATGLLYFTRPKILNRYPGKKVECIDIVDVLKEKKRNNALLIFIDDFIGTGDTAADAMHYYKENLAVDSDKVIIITLVSLQAGIDVLTAKGYKVFSTVILDRGITDSPKIANKDIAFEIMNRIEGRLQISPLFKNGYKASEALVSMVRTPNNTFPVFWGPKQIDGAEWPSPFLRR